MGQSVGGVILAGGQGSRLGYVNKAELIFRGKPFHRLIGEQLKAARIPYVISSGTREMTAAEGISVVRDEPVGIHRVSDDSQSNRPIGPMGGILTCFQKCGCERLFFVSCDMPLFHSPQATLLLDAWEDGVDGVIWRTGDGRLQPLCGLYSRSCLPALVSCVETGNYRIMGFLDRIAVKVLDTEAYGVPDEWFFNVNSMEAYQKLLGRKPPVMAVSGQKNTGKTTFLEGLVTFLKDMGLAVAVIKHDGHSFEGDVPGTDSYRMKKAGAYATAVYSDSRYCIVREQEEITVEAMIGQFDDADLILLEGQKFSDYPKMELVRKAVADRPVCNPETVAAYVTDLEPWESGVFSGKKPVFSFGQEKEAARFVMEWFREETGHDGMGGI